MKKFTSYLFLMVAVLCVAICFCRIHTKNFELFKTHVFISGEDGYHTYRIPSIIVTQKGTILAFCEGRKNDYKDQGNVDLLIKRSKDNGNTWSEQKIIHEEGDTAKITIGLVPVFTVEWKASAGM